MSDLHLKLLAEAGRWGDGSGTREPCVHCGGKGTWSGPGFALCPFCDGSGWEFIGRAHLQAAGPAPSGEAEPNSETTMPGVLKERTDTL